MTIVYKDFIYLFNLICWTSRVYDQNCVFHSKNLLFIAGVRYSEITGYRIPQLTNQNRVFNKAV